jgi:hypothetical protein
LDAINDEYLAINTLESVEQVLKDQIGAYVDKVLSEALANASKAAATGDKNALYMAMRPLPNIPGIEFRTLAEIEVEDIDAVPSEYLVKAVDKKLLLRDSKRGTIPGVVRTERTSVVVKLGKADPE